MVGMVETPSAISWCFGLRTRTYAAQRVLGKGSFGTVYQALAKNIQENMECGTVCGFLEGDEWCLSFFFCKYISSSWVPSFHLPGPSLGDGWDGAADEFKWLTFAMVMSIRRENWSKPTWERRKLHEITTFELVLLLQFLSLKGWSRRCLRSFWGHLTTWLRIQKMLVR